MAEVTSHLLTPWDFGRQLISTGDLDPVYIFLWEAYSAGDLPRSTLLRWLVAYLCFYNSGTASWITSQYLGSPTSRGVSWRLDACYWDAMETAAGSKDYPRAHERRHFRGDNAARSVAYLRTRGVDSLFAPLLASPAPGGSIALADVMEVIQGWVGFGPWIAFKAADMLERLGLTPVDFSGAERYFYKSPREGATLLVETFLADGGTNLDAEELISLAVGRIIGQLGATQAPPRYERPVNIQEAETILCKWYSYTRGHYRVREDVEASRLGLLRFPRCKVSQVLLRAGKRGGLW